MLLSVCKRLFIYVYRRKFGSQSIWQNTPQHLFGDFKFGELKQLTDHIPCGVFYNTSLHMSDCKRMAKFRVRTVIIGCHVYKNVCEPLVG